MPDKKPTPDQEYFRSTPKIEESLRHVHNIDRLERLINEEVELFSASLSHKTDNKRFSSAELHAASDVVRERVAELIGYDSQSYPCISYTGLLSPSIGGKKLRLFYSGALVAGLLGFINHDHTNRLFVATTL